MNINKSPVASVYFRNFAILFQYYQIQLIEKFSDHKFKLDFNRHILIMRPLAFFFVCGLSLLFSLQTVSVPVFSTLEQPFALRAATPEQWNLVLKFTTIAQRGGGTYNASIVRISHNNSAIPQFRLTDGNLTTVDGLTAAFFLNDLPALSPPSPFPLFFDDFATRTNHALTNRIPNFVAKTISTLSQGSILQLLTINRGEL